MIAAVFPGQGSQHVGMCQDFYEQFLCVRVLFQEIEDILHLNLRKIMFDGSDEDLRATDKAQPALFATSVAIAQVLSQEWGMNTGNWSMMAGHSLGEYTALYLSHALSLTQALELIQARGQAMATVHHGGMVAIIGMPHDTLSDMIEALNQEGIICVLANDNSPQQGVVSAASVDLPVISQRAHQCGAGKTVILKVSGPFHSAMMYRAQEVFDPILSTISFHSPLCPIVTNVSGKKQNHSIIIKNHTRQHMTHPVLWRESQLTMAGSGLTHMVEIGAGKVLCGLAKKTIPLVQTYALNSVDGIKEWGHFWNTADPLEPPHKILSNAGM